MKTAVKTGEYGNATVKAMTFDVSTTEAAKAWLQRRPRKLGLLFLLGVVLSPVASAIVVSIKYFSKAHQLPPLGPLVTSSLMWAAIIVALMVIVVMIIGVKYFKFAQRVRPILEAGQPQTGTVTDVRFDSRRKGGVTLHKETLTVETESKATFTVAIEETEGTHLPKVEPGAPATVWMANGQAVVGTSGALFESAAT
jgi:hypothetical protein